ncbi:MAG: hypothetical protein HQL74_03905 [Magnetococcales bacterium]|nr:hypothetical protein [Magnetococcales bacterium]MBF0421190.1 hypothetical protein [Magnetococcales bacterium]
MAFRALTVSKHRSPKSQILAMFSYLGVLCLISLMFNDNGDDYVRFHAKQGLVLWIWGILAIFSLYVPVLGGFIFSFSVLMITLFAIAGVVSVLFSRAWRLPFIYQLASLL